MVNRIFKKESITSKDKLDDLLKNTDAVGECLLWNRALNTDGYPRMAGNVKVHRLAYELATGDNVKGLVIRHSCDNPLCINPDHLLKGTPTENMQDRDSRGRTYRVVTLPIVRKTLVLLDTGVFLQKEIAEIVGLNPRRVSDINRGLYCSATGKFLGRG